MATTARSERRIVGIDLRQDIHSLSPLEHESYRGTMRLSTFTDYNLRVLMYLGIHPDRLATIPEIAEAHRISENHLTKVVHQLGRRGYLKTVRGKGGGVRLAMSPEEIVLGDVIRQTEGDIQMAECFTANSTCRVQRACRLQGILVEALTAMFLVFDAYTLADLLKKPQDHLQAINWKKNLESA